VRAEADAARPVIAALADVTREGAALTDRDAFRTAVAKVRERTGQKGKSLLHPIRLALTGESEGLELDLAVPAIERGAALGPSGLPPMLSAAERATAFHRALGEPHG
jgi:glutamyl-tRNA synthetase